MLISIDVSNMGAPEVFKRLSSQKRLGSESFDGVLGGVRCSLSLIPDRWLERRTIHSIPELS